MFLKNKTDNINYFSQETINAEKLELVDSEHGLAHIESVTKLTAKLMDRLKHENVNYDADVCLLSAYCHDICRSQNPSSHELDGAVKIRDELKNSNKYTDDFCQNVYNAIVFHKWSMKPQTTEGLIIRDADKLDWLSKWRWDLYRKQNINKDDIEIIKLLPQLRNKILYYECSKKLHDEMVLRITKHLKYFNIKIKIGA